MSIWALTEYITGVGALINVPNCFSCTMQKFVLLLFDFILLCFLLVMCMM